MINSHAGSSTIDTSNSRVMNLMRLTTFTRSGVSIMLKMCCVFQVGYVRARFQSRRNEVVVYYSLDSIRDSQNFILSLLQMQFTAVLINALSSCCNRAGGCGKYQMNVCNRLPRGVRETTNMALFKWITMQLCTRWIIFRMQYWCCIRANICQTFAKFWSKFCHN